MKAVTAQKRGSGDSIPSGKSGGSVSGVGTGGGKSEVETTHHLKDNAAGGALPDTQDGLDSATAAKHYTNEKAMEGTLELEHGMPSINAGDKITIRGVGPIFSGDWIVKTHTLKVGSDGCHSSLELTRNAAGNSSKSEPNRKFDPGKKQVSPKPLGASQKTK